MRPFWHKKEKKTLILGLHGFGRRRTDEFNSLADAFSGKYDFLLPELYNPLQPSNSDWTQWVARAEKALLEATKDGQTVTLLGYSMGGVLATYLGNRPGVDRVVLIAPAFEYQPLKKGAELVMKPFLKEKKPLSSYPELPSSFTNGFMDVVAHCKKSVETLTSPVLLLHGDADSVIAPASSAHAFEKIPSSDKHLLFLHGGTHQMMDDPDLLPYLVANITFFNHNS